jgi:rhodanese-related sulfurtransferase
MTSPAIPIASAAEKYRNHAQILDVRTPAEFESMHVEGSILAPLSELDAESLKDVIDPEAPLLVMCRSGKRAVAACEKLEGTFPNAAIIEGGIVAWSAAGQPVNRGRAVMSLERQVRIAAGLLIVLGSLLTWNFGLGFLLIPAFVGAGLVFAGVTDSCGMGMMLAKMPWNRSVGNKAKAALATS